MKEVVLVVATTLSKREFWESAPIARYLSEVVEKHPNMIYSILYKNTSGLPEVYNKYLLKENDERILVFVHDDVDIQDAFLYEKLNEALIENDIVGLAGAKVVSAKSPALWHLMSDKNSWSGAVAHKFPDGTIHMSSFGPTPKRVLVIDGLFIAINTEKVLEANVKFDEKFKFHFYDLDFSLTANAARLKATTWPIWVIHSGLGDSFQSKEWKRMEPVFLDKWGGKNESKDFNFGGVQ